MTDEPQSPLPDPDKLNGDDPAKDIEEDLNPNVVPPDA